MEPIARKIAAAFEAVQRGALDQARAILGSVPAHQHGCEGYHLVTAILERKSGNPARAKESFDRALALFPGNAAIHNGLANLHDDMGNTEAALAGYRKALAVAPHYVDARYNLGLVHRRLGHSREACAELEKVVELAPAHGSAWLALALCYSTLGSLDRAGHAVGQAIRIRPQSVQAWRAHAAIEKQAGRSGVDSLQRAAQIDPGNADVALELADALAETGAILAAKAAVARVASIHREVPAVQRALAKLRWQAGEQERFVADYESVLAGSADPELWQGYFTTLAQAGRYERILERIADARSALQDPSAFRILEAIAASETGDERLADRVFSTFPETGDPETLVARGRHLLRTRRPAEAAAALEKAVAEGATGAWPYLSLAWRLEGDPRAAWLDNPATISVQDDPDFQALLPDLIEYVRPLHISGAAHLDQTVRGGSQTVGNLLAAEATVLKTFSAVVDRNIARYLESLPPPDPAHPFLGVPRQGFRLAGSWSVRLTGGGIHTNHVHPAGWISSAFYLAVPSVSPGDRQDAGQLAFGEGPAELGLPVEPIRMIAPRPGRLVLFPSIMWHGTRPAPPGERITIAFDVVPGQRSEG